MPIELFVIPFLYLYLGICNPPLVNCPKVVVTRILSQRMNAQIATFRPSSRCELGVTLGQATYRYAGPLSIPLSTISTISGPPGRFPHPDFISTTQHLLEAQKPPDWFGLFGVTTLTGFAYDYPQAAAQPNSRAEELVKQLNR
jgi:hypothetical protein